MQWESFPLPFPPSPSLGIGNFQIEWSKYRTRAINHRSRLVAAPLRNHAKKHFLCVFYVIISNFKAKKIIYNRGG